MLALWFATLASAGDLIEVRWGPQAPEYRHLDTTKVGDGTIVTWPDQAVEVMVLADLSGSINKEEAHQMALTLETLYDSLLERAHPGDRFGVTAFAGNVQRWIPVGALNRPGLAGWVDRFDVPRAIWAAPIAFGDHPDVIPVPPDPRVIDRGETDAARGVDAATRDLDALDPHALKVIVMLWDGGHNGWGHLEGALDRAWSEEIHVWSVSFNARPLGPLVTRGGGDAYLVTDCGPIVAERIASELRF